MMTEQIKSALLKWADKVFKNESDWDAVFDAVETPFSKEYAAMDAQEKDAVHTGIAF